MNNEIKFERDELIRAYAESLLLPEDNHPVMSRVHKMLILAYEQGMSDGFDMCGRYFVTVEGKLDERNVERSDNVSE